VTVIAAGFDESQQRPAPTVVPQEQPVEPAGPVAEESWLLPGEETPVGSEAPSLPVPDAPEDDELDVPEFLR